jgi:hypothetical protein
MKTIHAIVVTLLLLSSCIGQEEKEKEEPEGEWTVTDWKEHLSFGTFRIDQNIPTGIVTGLDNIDTVPPGTHIVYTVETKGGANLDMPVETTVDITVLGSDSMDNTPCTLIDIVITMTMTMFGESMTTTFEGKEWVDDNGVPVKAELEGVQKLQDFEAPTSLRGMRTGEDVFYGHDCWVFTMTQRADMDVSSIEMEVIQYLDKETSALVRVITRIGEKEQDTGYIEPASTGELEWVLGDKEVITTKAGTYDCQLIYVKDEEKTVVTMWAAKDVAAPIRCVYSYAEGVVIMTLVAYS